MTPPKALRAASFLFALALPSWAGVIAVPSSPVPSLTLPSAVNSARPASPLSLPFNSSPLMPLTASLAPMPAPPPSALVPTRVLASAPSLPTWPGTPIPLDSARSLNNFWDGLDLAFPKFDEPFSVAVPLAGPVNDLLGEAERLAPWLEADNAKIAAALDRAAALARTTRAGRRAFAEAERVLAEQGRTLPVLVQALGSNYGEYDYIAKNMRLHKALFEKGREADLAGTLVHELTHVVQHTQGVPSNALEMEIEAHLQDLDMLLELGLKPPPHTFARQALDALAESPKKFIALLQAAVPGTVFLGDSSFEDIDDQLEDDLAEHTRRAAHSKASAGLVPAIERDIDLLRTPEGRASYRAFSKRVLSLLRRRAKSASKSVSGL